MPRFDKLAESEKRDVYVSLKVGYAQQQAKMALAKSETGNSNQLAEYEKKASLFQSMLKSILPKDFKGEFDTLKEIQQKRENAGKMFDAGKESFLSAVEQMTAKQAQLKEFAP